MYVMHELLQIIWEKFLMLRGKRPMLDAFRLAESWIDGHFLPGCGLTVSNRNRKSYPEVSGYFIPTLIACGKREMAITIGRWLVSIQNKDGSWSDPGGQNPYTFDTGQILKGLLVLLDRNPEFEDAIRQGCSWLFSRVESTGRVSTPDTSQWRLPENRMVPEAIHLYALEPLAKVGRRWSKPAYMEAVERALDYYVTDARCLDFTTLSHFHAYIVEALVDLGRRVEASRAMIQVNRLQRPNGAVPAYADSGWVCSTGLFQYAIVWYKLGDVKRADIAFDYACRLQNKSGGFYGGYGWGVNYFQREEISWAVKYFLDAFHWKVRSEFDRNEGAFPDTIDENDGRYRLVADIVSATGARRILDAGCGKGRFLRRLALQFPQIELSGLDLSDRMLESLPKGITCLSGGLLDIPASEGSYDLVICCEALEHVVNVSAAIGELRRVLNKGGTLVIIDKNVNKLGQLRISEWEQWFSVSDMINMLDQNGFTVSVFQNISYDDKDGSDGLFVGWVAR
jgi:malonyl-CoA O-methyltransferase